MCHIDKNVKYFWVKKVSEDFIEMKQIKTNKRYLWNFYVFPLVLLTSVSCYPTGKPDLEMLPDIRDEKHFPNGTVIGKYSYTDNEGNPIQVKYYADDGSYGVELKSIKVVDATGDPLPSTMNTMPQAKYEMNTMPQAKYELNTKIEPDVKLPTDITHTGFPEIINKYKASSDPYDFLNRELMTKVNHYNKVQKSGTDYDIYYQNELKGPKKCGKEKVRVYYDKERKIRNAINNFEADKFCEQF